jgi:hydrogenase maturation protease
MTPATRVLVAGVGNIFLGDDAFGVEVARRLGARAWPEGVRVVDFGIRGLDLAFALESCDAAILVDATARGGAPGTLYVIEPRAAEGARDDGSAHGMTIERVLASLPPSAAPRTIRLVGCEPSRFGDDGDDGDDVDDEAPGLSAAVSGSLDEAVRLVEALVEELLAEPRPDA